MATAIGCQHTAVATMQSNSRGMCLYAGWHVAIRPLSERGPHHSPGEPHRVHMHEARGIHRPCQPTRVPASTPTARAEQGRHRATLFDRACLCD